MVHPVHKLVASRQTSLATVQMSGTGVQRRPGQRILCAVPRSKRAAEATVAASPSQRLQQRLRFVESKQKMGDHGGRLTFAQRSGRVNGAAAGRLGLVLLRAQPFYQLVDVRVDSLDKAKVPLCRLDVRQGLLACAVFRESCSL